MRDVQQMDFHLWALQELAIGESGGAGRPWRKSRSPSDYESVADSIGVADTRAVISYPFHVAGAAEGVVVAHAFANFYVITT